MCSRSRVLFIHAVERFVSGWNLRTSTYSFSLFSASSGCFLHRLSASSKRFFAFISGIFSSNSMSVFQTMLIIKLYNIPQPSRDFFPPERSVNVDEVHAFILVYSISKTFVPDDKVRHAPPLNLLLYEVLTISQWRALVGDEKNFIMQRVDHTQMPRRARALRADVSLFEVFSSFATTHEVFLILK